MNIPPFESLTSEEVLKLPPGSAVLPDERRHTAGVVLVGNGPYFRDCHEAQIDRERIENSTCKWLLVFRNTPQAPPS